MPPKPRPPMPPTYSAGRDPSARYRVHDGTAAQTTLEIEGVPAVNLPYDDAMRAKQFAVSRLKCRTATVELIPASAGASEAPTAENDATSADASTAPAQGSRPGFDGPLMGAVGGIVTQIPGHEKHLGSVTTPDSPPNPDPALEAMRLSSLAAGKAAATAAAERNAKLEREKQEKQAQQEALAKAEAAARAAIAAQPYQGSKPVMADTGLDDLDGESDDALGNVDDLMVGDPKADLERARQEAEAVRAKRDAAGKALFEETFAAELRDGTVKPWSEQLEKDRADYRWQADELAGKSATGQHPAEATS